VEPADLSSGLVARLSRSLKAQVEDWYDVCRQLSAWEERHLVERPTPDRLADHARLLDELEEVGQWLGLATQNAAFPDRAAAALVAMAVQDLKDRRALWHGPLSAEQREMVLRDVFREP
jgi:hypothetical protein